MPDGIQLKPVKSSAIEAYGYDQASQTLEVQFKGGRRYRYEGVSLEQAAAIERSESPGRAVNALLRGFSAAATQRQPTLRDQYYRRGR